MTWWKRLKEWIKCFFSKETKKELTQRKEPSVSFDKSEEETSFVEEMNKKMAQANGKKIETDICLGDGLGIKDTYHY